MGTPVASFTSTPASGVAPLGVSFDASASADTNNAYPEFRAAGTTLGPSGMGDYTGTISVSHPAGLAVNDSIVVTIGTSVFPESTGSVTYSMPGFDLVNSESQILGSNRYELHVFHKTATSADVTASASTVNVTSTGSGNTIVARTYAFSGSAGLLGTANAVAHPASGAGSTYSAPDDALTLFAILRRASSAGFQVPSSPTLINYGAAAPVETTANLKTWLTGLQTPSGANTTLTYGTADSSSVRISVAFGLASDQGWIENYIWDFGNGDTGTGVNPYYEYSTQGVYEVTLTVQDNDGETDTATQTVVVLPPADACECYMRFTDLGVQTDYSVDYPGTWWILQMDEMCGTDSVTVTSFDYQSVDYPGLPPSIPGSGWTENALSITASLPTPMIGAFVSSLEVDGLQVLLRYSFLRNGCEQYTVYVFVRRIGGSEVESYLSTDAGATWHDSSVGAPLLAAGDCSGCEPTTDTDTIDITVLEPEVPPPPAVEPERTFPPAVADSSVPAQPRLGIGYYQVWVYSRGGERQITVLPRVTELSYGRVLDDTSQASVKCVSEEWADLIHPWQHEIHIIRNREKVWSGPVRDKQYDPEDGAILLECRDLFSWMDFRTAHDEIDLVESDIADVFKALIDSALRIDPSPNITIDKQNVGATIDFYYDPEVPKIVGEDLRQLSEAGVDYTVVNRTLYIRNEYLDKAPIATLVRAHLAKMPTIKESGEMATQLYLNGSGGDLHTHPDFPLNPEQWAIHPYGLLEQVADADKLFDSDDVSAVEKAAKSRYELMKEPRLFISDLQLDKSAPVTMDGLIPGRRIDIRLSVGSIPLITMYRLHALNVEVDSKSEKVSLEVTSIGDYDKDTPL